MGDEIGVVGDDNDDDVERVDEKVVDHLEVGGLRHRVVDVCLNVRHHQHDRDRHHHSILQLDR